MNTDQADEIALLLRPSLSHLGLELLDVQWSGRGRGAVLRLIIDRPHGDVSLDDCERASNAASAVLDVHDPISDPYRLEVSSPGAERPIRSREQWVAALGRRVNLRLRAGGDGAETVLEGRLVALQDAHAELELRRCNGTHVVEVDLDEVIAARIAVDI